MGVLSSNFPAFALGRIFSNTGKIGLGSNETTPISGGGYADASASSASWIVVSSGTASVYNNGKVYFPEATAAYTVNHIHIKSGSNQILYTIAVDPLSVAVADRVKINKYVSGASRGINVSLWEA